MPTGLHDELISLFLVLVNVRIECIADSVALLRGQYTGQVHEPLLMQIGGRRSRRVQHRFTALAARTQDEIQQAHCFFLE